MPLHLYSLVDSFTKLGIIEDPRTNKSVWTFVEYFICRTKFIESIDNISMITILFKGFETVATLDSISVEEVYESLEPKLIELIDQEFQNNESHKSHGNIVGKKHVVDLVEIFRCFNISLEGTSEIHTKLMQNIFDNITYMNIDHLCQLLYSLAYKKIYFERTRTPEEEKIEKRLVDEANVQLIKNIIKIDQLKEGEDMNKAIFRNLRNIVDEAKIHELEWSLSVLFK
mmetsp:Transcript_23075/g.20490  ORF Transcript_23075/g.20490 Transcript_23075/m.20490 type:complete len:228 (-) Transcript_23075:13-696(-)